MQVRLTNVRPQSCCSVYLSRSFLQLQKQYRLSEAFPPQSALAYYGLSHPAHAYGSLTNSSPNLENLPMTAKSAAKKTQKKSIAPLSGSKRTVLPGSEKSAFASAASDKPAPLGTKITVSVLVRHKNPLKAANRNGRERLTRPQYRRLHGADPVAVKLVRAFAKEYGLNVAPDTPGPERCMIKLVGTIGAMQKAFGVTLVHKTYEGATYRVREGSITLPAQ